MDEAEAVLKPQLRDRPNAESYNLLGSILEKRGGKTAAAQAFAEAVRLAPANEDFRIDYGSSLIDAGVFDEAAAVFSRGAAALPQSVRLPLGLGSALYLAGRYDEAARATLACVRRAPSFAPAYDLLGKMFDSARERQAEIMEVFRTYLQTAPRNAGAHVHYAAMLFSSAEGEAPARYQDARQHLRQALALDPRLGQAHVQLGMILQAEGNLPAALASYRRAIALVPADAAARYRLASAYQKLGNHAQARIEMEAFRALKDKQQTEDRKALLRGVSGNAAGIE